MKARTAASRRCRRSSRLPRKVFAGLACGGDGAWPCWWVLSRPYAAAAADPQAAKPVLEERLKSLKSAVASTWARVRRSLAASS